MLSSFLTATDQNGAYQSHVISGEKKDFRLIVLRELKLENRGEGRKEPSK